MQIESYDILPALKPYVSQICTMDCDGGLDRDDIRVLPDTRVEIFINYTSSPVAIIDNELYKGSIVNFRMNKPVDVQMRKGEGCMAVCFQPGMAYRFFKIPLHLLSNSTTPLAELWEKKAAMLEALMADGGTHNRRVALLQQYLLQELRKAEDNLAIEYCLQQIQLSKGLISLAALTSHIGFSQRHLSRQFQQYVGLSPRDYLRVSRFIYSLERLKSNPTRSLTRVAYQSGYYDQAHFIRDYKQYTGFTPGEVLRSKNIL
ncbi:AraC family transcriptional regulator [Pedobacter sp. HDW13]|uniref:AraC family transcriptional regulator n=1 Tax=Pedobacter sp. HDW13 TaxID=2714940 RepID=UPI001407336C|nr:helix-turn-helix domain-containing protein [Pedobacter sp. HDW13]QIL40367.1 AraC family transcriptional regulator [Pedobacter sp. HDW13]